MLTEARHIAANAVLAASRVRSDRMLAQERLRPLLGAEPAFAKEFLDSIEREARIGTHPKDKDLRTRGPSGVTWSAPTRFLGFDGLLGCALLSDCDCCRLKRSSEAAAIQRILTEDGEIVTMLLTAAVA